MNIYKDCLFPHEGGAVLQLSCIPPLFAQIVSWLLIFAGVVSLIIIIYSGIRFITSGGDPKQAEGARKTLTYAILGLVLILLSYAIVVFIAQTTDTEITPFLRLPS